MNNKLMQWLIHKTPYMGNAANEGRPKYEEIGDTQSNSSMVSIFTDITVDEKIVL